jgi:hypothetical protein
MESRGLGDSIEKITKTTGLKTLTELAMQAIGKKSCGCNRRKQWLNKQFPYYK